MRQHTGTLSVKLFFERHLVDTLIQQLKKMVSTEDASKFMEERAKKKKNIKPTSTLAASFFSSLSRWREKRKEPESGWRPVKETQKRRKEAQFAEEAAVMSV